MSTKPKLRGSAPKSGKHSPTKPTKVGRGTSAKPAAPVAAATPPAAAISDIAPASAAASSAPPISSDASQSAPHAPPSSAAALDILDAAQESAAAAASSPAGSSAAGASELLAEAQQATPGASTQEPAKRRGGYPRGVPRNPDGTANRDASNFRSTSERQGRFPNRAPAGAAAGASAEDIDVAKLQAENAALRAQHDENVRNGMAAGFSQLFRILGGFMARRRGVHWLVPQDEADELGEATAGAALPMIEYVAPALPFLTAAAAIYGSMSTRLEIDAKIDAGEVPRVMPGAAAMSHDQPGVA